MMSNSAAPLTPIQEIEELSTLLLLKCPLGLELGFDNQVWKIGPQFKGIKCIPPGPHFLHFRLADQDPTVAEKICMFTFLHKAEIAVYTWNEEQCYFKRVEGDDAECYAEGVRALDFFPNLGPYPIDQIASWKKIAYLLSEKLLAHICPPNMMEKTQQKTEHPKSQKEIEEEIKHLEDKIDAMGGIDAAEEEYDLRQKKKKQAKKEKRKMEGFTEPDDIFNFSHIPRRKTIPGVLGHDLTSVNFDKSSILAEIIDREYYDDPVMLVGEQQLCFILFFTGERLEGLKQWKQLTSLLCSCEKIKPIQVFEQFTTTLYQQLKLFPPDLFQDTVLQDSFLRASLLSYLELTQDIKRLRSKRKKLLALLKQQFNLTLPSTLISGKEETKEQSKADNKFNSGIIQEDVIMRDQEAQLDEGGWGGALGGRELLGNKEQIQSALWGQGFDQEDMPVIVDPEEGLISF